MTYLLIAGFLLAIAVGLASGTLLALLAARRQDKRVEVGLVALVEQGVHLRELLKGWHEADGNGNEEEEEEAEEPLEDLVRRGTAAIDNLRRVQAETNRLLVVRRTEGRSYGLPSGMSATECGLTRLDQLLEEVRWANDHLKALRTTTKNSIDAGGLEPA